MADAIHNYFTKGIDHAFTQATTNPSTSSFHEETSTLDWEPFEHQWQSVWHHGLHGPFTPCDCFRWICTLHVQERIRRRIGFNFMNFHIKPMAALTFGAHQKYSRHTVPSTPQCVPLQRISRLTASNWTTQETTSACAGVRMKHRMLFMQWHFKHLNPARQSFTKRGPSMNIHEIVQEEPVVEPHLWIKPSG